MTSTMPTQRESFLRAIAAAPQDDLPRKVFSDWLMDYAGHEQGERADSDRAWSEYIRASLILDGEPEPERPEAPSVVVALAKMAIPFIGAQLVQARQDRYQRDLEAWSAACVDRNVMRHRCRWNLNEYGSDWAKPLVDAMCNRPRKPAKVCCSPYSLEVADSDGCHIPGESIWKWSWSRGCINELEMPWRDWRDLHARIVQVIPLERLTLVLSPGDVIDTTNQQVEPYLKSLKITYHLPE